MAEEIEEGAIKPPRNMAANNIKLAPGLFKSFDIISLSFYRLALDRLRHASVDGFLSFHDIDVVLGRFKLIHSERVGIMKELEAAGKVSLIPMKGWKILEHKC